MFFMFQEVFFCTVLYDFNFYVLYVPGSLLLYCSFIIVNFYVLYVPGSLLLYCSLWLLFLCSLCSRKFIFVLFFIIVISMFSMFQEVYFCTVLYDCNFYVLYVPGSVFLYCSLWFWFLCSLCSRKFIVVLFFMIVISMFFMFQEVHFCTVLYDCNFYVLYVPGSLFLYGSLWF